MPAPEHIPLTHGDIESMTKERFKELLERQRLRDAWYFPTPESLAEGADILVDVSSEDSPIPLDEMNLPGGTTAVKVYKSEDGRLVYIRSYEEDGKPRQDIYAINPGTKDIWGMDRMEPSYASAHGHEPDGGFVGKMLPLGKDNGYVNGSITTLRKYLGAKSEAVDDKREQ